MLSLLPNLRDEIAPKFKENKFFDGLAAGVSAISRSQKVSTKAKEKSSNGVTGDLVITGIIFKYHYHSSSLS